MVSDAASQISRLSPAEAQAAVGAGAIIVDIRDTASRERNGVIPGSLHIPQTKLEWRVALDSDWRNPHIGGLDAQILLVCDGGYASTLAAANLVRLGFARAGDVVGGFEAWSEAGLPVTAAPPRSDAEELPGMGGPQPAG